MSYKRWTNIETTLKSHCIKFGQRCINVGRRHCINVVQCWKSEVEFTTLKQCSSDIEMLARFFFYILTGRSVDWVAFRVPKCLNFFNNIFNTCSTEIWILKHYLKFLMVATFGWFLNFIIALLFGERCY